MSNAAQNIASSQELGWDPTWLSMPPNYYGLELEDQICALQAAYGLPVTGIVDGPTFLRLAGEQMVEGAEEGFAGPVSDFIVHDGKRLTIPWDRVVSFDEEGGRAIEQFYTKPDGKRGSRFCERNSKRYGEIARVGFHWTATTSAARTWKFAWCTKRSVSTHFEIDYDGTIYQLVDTRFASYNYGARWMNHSSVGVDLTLHPGKVGKAAATNKHLVEELGQPERPVMTGWSLAGWKPQNYVGPHEVQIEALHALMWALHEHLGIPLECPGDDPAKPKHIARHKGSFKLSKCPPGWYHHCYGVQNRWDTLGVALTEELGKAGELSGSKPKKKASKKKKKEAK